MHILNHFLAKICADTVENEPTVAKIFTKTARNSGWGKGEGGQGEG